MRYTIIKEFAATLVADSRLIAGGSAYSAGWTYAVRDRDKTVYDENGLVEDAPIPSSGAVYVFERPLIMDSRAVRPGIYFGAGSHIASDKLDSLVTSAKNQQTEYRRIILPLVIATVGNDWYDPQDQAAQLVYNIRTIMYDWVHKTNYWFELVPFNSDSESDSVELDNVSGSGQGASGSYESTVVVSYTIRYQRHKNVTVP